VISGLTQECEDELKGKMEEQKAASWSVTGL
jgi:hypothetical protein